MPRYPPLAHGTPRHVKLSTSTRQKRATVSTEHSELDAAVPVSAEVAVELEVGRYS
jgi:hypothetical protein